MLKLLPVLLAPALAHADAAQDLAKEIDGHINYWTDYRDDPGSRAGSLATDPTPQQCSAAVAKAKKAGLAADAKIYSSRFTEWKSEVEYDDKRQAYVTLGDIDTVCATWAKMVILAPAAAQMTKVAQTQATYSLIEPGDLGADMASVFAKDGKECLVLVDKAIAAGVPATHRIVVKDEVITVTEGRAKCEAFVAWTSTHGGKIKGAHDADRAKREAPYKALGVAGAKLALFVEYDDVYWRGGANCQRITDIKAVAKAKVLFQWLENADGTHTIRKYTFTGNKVSGPVSKTYRTPGAAQAGCK